MDTGLAPQTGILDIMEEYAEKAEAMASQIQAFDAAIKTMEGAACVWGTFAGNVVDTRSGPHEAYAQRNLLKSAWMALYKRLNINQLASAADRKRFEMLFEKPPEMALEKVAEVFGDYYVRPRFHVLRGLAEVFTTLDPAYKSHSKVRIGVKGLPKRVILSNFGNYGSWGFERFGDMMRAIAIYRGEPLPKNGDLYELRSKGGTYRGLEIRTFANGNAHIIFDQQTMLDVNRALAEFYGEVLPDAEPENGETPTKQQSTSVSKDLAYYPTPKAVVDRLIDKVYLKPDSKVLEPSCGCGRIMDALRDKSVNAFGIEYDAKRAHECRTKGHDVLTANFLEVPPVAEYDFVLMNPPFVGRHYVKHVRHALKFLKPGGYLYAILPATAHYDHGELDGMWTDLPVASFAESGTNVPTGIMCLSSKSIFSGDESEAA